MDALAESVQHAASASLSKLVLDLNLGTSQVAQLCGALEDAPQVTVLHLPHLGCGRDGLKAIANLVKARPLVALNLTGSWGMRRDDPPSSTGNRDFINILLFYVFFPIASHKGTCILSN